MKSTAEILDPEEDELQAFEEPADPEVAPETKRKHGKRAKLAALKDKAEPTEEELAMIEADETENVSDGKESYGVFLYNLLQNQPLLTREGEIVAGKRILESLTELRKLEAKKKKLETRQSKTGSKNVRKKCADEIKGMEKIISRSQAAFNDAVNKLVVANLRLVISIVMRRRWMYEYDETFDGDAIDEGSIGLMSAAQRFDYRKGYKFSTYATWWIRQSVDRAVTVKYWRIRVPVHGREKMADMRRVEKYLTNILSRKPINAEIAVGLRDELKLKETARGNCIKKFGKKFPREVFYAEMSRLKGAGRRTLLPVAEAALAGQGIERPEAKTGAEHRFRGLLEKEINGFVAADIMERAKPDLSDLEYRDRYVDLNAGYVAMLKRLFALNRGGSLNQPLGDTENSLEIIDVLAAPKPVDAITDDEREKIAEVFRQAQLSEREERVLKERFGFEDSTSDGEKKTLLEIGKEYELSRERIRQVQESALSKVRRVVGLDQELAKVLREIMERSD